MGGERQYSLLPDAIDRREYGDVKYRPAIIHFSNGAPSYPNARYVVVIGKSGNVYSVPESNRDAIWTIFADDTPFSCIDCVMQYYNAEALTQPKVIVPNDVTPSKLQLKVTSRGDAVIRTGSARTYSVIRHADRGEYPSVIGYRWNSKNHLCHFMEDGTYIYSLILSPVIERIAEQKGLSMADVEQVAARTAEEMFRLSESRIGCSLVLQVINS